MLLRVWPVSGFAAAIHSPGGSTLKGCFMKCKQAFWKVSPVLLVAFVAAGCAARSAVGSDPRSQDQRITEEVLRIISEKKDVVGEDLQVETRDGVVVISGVQTEDAPVGELLMRIARVRGVLEVVNRIRILRGRERDRGGG